MLSKVPKADRGELGGKRGTASNRSSSGDGHGERRQRSRAVTYSTRAEQVQSAKGFWREIKKRCA
jgi:hypothetical protein